VAIAQLGNEGADRVLLLQQMSSKKSDPSADVLRQACLRLSCSAVAVVVADSRSRKLWAPDDAEREFAVAQLRIVGQELARRSIADGAPIVTNRLRHTENGPIACKVAVVPLRNATGSVVAAMVALSRPESGGFDDAAVRQLEKFALSLARANASVDARLSGLLAAPVFQATADNWLTTSAAGRSYCIAYGNIDRMHLVNDVAGFDAGDGVIRDAAAAIRARLRQESGATSRGSGDRFTLFLPDRTAEQARQLVADIGKDIAVRSVEHVGSKHTVTMSWGIAPATVGGETLNASLAAAELACRTAKDRGRNRVEIYERQDASMLRRHEDVAAISKLQDALRDGRIEMFAQTIVPLLNEQLAPSYELLVRLRDPHGAIVEPAAFMSAAMRYQMLPDIDRAVVKTAFAQLRDHFNRFPDSALCVSINLSGPTICEPQFLDFMLTALAEYGISGSHLVLEMTEAAAAANMERVQKFMRRLGAEGVRFALDDFGTGVNSLSYLKSLDIGTIKLDGSYVRDIERNTRSEALVRAIVQLADGMGIVTVAEYVETQGIRKRLAELGVQYGQGFAIARPVPLADVLESLVDSESAQMARAG